MRQKGVGHTEKWGGEERRAECKINKKEKLKKQCKIK
jgi:hypothetical protein